MNEQKRKALIIGGGIAGPTLALFLQRAGIEAEIYEARETPEGFSLSLSCNGVAVLQELGLDRAAFAEGSAVTAKRAFFGYHVSPTGYIYWFVNWPQAEEPSKGAFEGITDEERKQQMLELFRDDQPFIREIIQAAEESFTFFPSYALPKQPANWHKGPVVLLGDAAHAISPSSGQGASMALEDAMVLAKCLRDVPDLEQAFVAYENLRRERTEKMYEVGERGDSGKHVTRPMKQWFRDLTTPIFLKLFANPKASDWMYSYRVDWDAPVTAHASETIESQKVASHASVVK